MTVQTLPRVNAAVEARGGADLYRLTLTDRLPATAFAAQGDGSIVVSGMDLLKSGTFNGLSLLDEDLEAMAARFADLRDAGVFLPPFRLDHSWSVLSVVGFFESVETYVRVDETDNLRKTFLRGDVRLTGSVDYTARQIVDAIKRGALRSRSSELGYYLTNAGVELPLVFYGCAFVDIPAVEGLAPVGLSRRSPVPHRITNLDADQPNPEGTPSMDPTRLARLRDLRALSAGGPLPDDDATELATLSAEQSEAGISDEDVDAAPDADGSTPVADVVEETGTGDHVPDVELEDDPAGTDPAVEVDDPPADPTEPAAPPTGAAGTPVVDDEATAELSRLRDEVTRLRAAATDREVAAFRRAGVIVSANEEAAVGLLSHDDEGVRRMAGTILGSMTARVELGRRHGRADLSAASSASGDGGTLIRLGMDKDEVGALWRDLTTEERKIRQGEYDAWRADRQTSGARD